MTAKKGVLLLGLACGTSGVTVPTGEAPASWPGATPADSNKLWPEGVQPPRLGHWEIDAQGRPIPCWKTTALHDTANGWPGQCLGLFQDDAISSEELCKQACWKDPRCSVWQLVNSTKPSQCWIGEDGRQCDLREGLNKKGTFQVKRSQRLQHGNIHVYKPSLSGMFVKNLFNFGLFAEGTQQLSISRCRDMCYSALVCQYWLYSTETGCWADAPSESTKNGKFPNSQVSYPLSASDVETGTDKAKSVIAGEFLVHYCPLQEVLTKPPVDPFYHREQESDNSWLVWLISGILLLLALCALAYYFLVYVPGKKKDKRESLVRGGRDNFDTDASKYSDDYRDYMQNGRGPMKAPDLDETQMSHYTSGTPGQESFGPPPQPTALAFPQPARPTSPTAMRHVSQGYQQISQQQSAQQMANMPTMLMPPAGQQSWGQQASLGAQRQSTPAPAMGMAYRPQQPMPPYPGAGGGRLM
eukprot:TRINITY_DN102952_c0_g1_i1.p1 TRINITY_DN102952_c0_g1~~TRINITY_DN102952_c0_g1_i1.p1  ORF type:complete len:470 (+),score=59.44 TRINITY_DN102952_c0_g1_i1:49-1458(+)